LQLYALLRQAHGAEVGFESPPMSIGSEPYRPAPLNAEPPVGRRAHLDVGSATDGDNAAA